MAVSDAEACGTLPADGAALVAAFGALGEAPPSAKLAAAPTSAYAAAELQRLRDEQLSEDKAFTFLSMSMSSSMSKLTHQHGVHVYVHVRVCAK